MQLTKSPATPLSKPNIRGTKWDPNTLVLDIHDSHGFLQAIGYLKYTLKGPVLFRGQTRPYPTMPPSLFRSIKSDSQVNKRSQVVTAAMKTLTTLGNGTPPELFEPLLQHYGASTRWLDLVDNAWIALWFACHEAHIHSGTTVTSLHFAPAPLPRRGTVTNSPVPYVYVYALNAGAELASPSDGIWSTASGATLIDLRRAAPSTFLRPHAQHGWVLRRESYKDLNAADLGDFVVGAMRVSLEDAFSWIGSGALLDPRSLFPSAHYDHGYAGLLDRPPALPSLLGRIYTVTP